MARTKGSGWGGAKINWLICPYCGKKKAMFIGYGFGNPYKCTSCKTFFRDIEKPDVNLDYTNEQGK